MVGVSLVTAAAPALPKVALDVFHPAADDTPRLAAGILLGVATVLNDTPPVLDDTLHPAAGIFLGVAPVLDDTPPVLSDTLRSAAGVLVGVASVLDDTPSPADILPPAVERSVP